MAKAYLLTEEDRAAIARLMEMVESTPQRPPRAQHDNFNEDQVGPSVYLARVPDTGIAALNEGAVTGTGTGTVTDDDVPGYADCEIYRVLQSTNQIIPLHTIRRVYNLSTTAIRRDSWAIVVREGSGAWLVVAQPPTTSTGGGIGRIQTLWRYVCISGKLRAYKTTLTFENGLLAKATPETYDHDEGCCNCPDDPPGTGTGTEDQCIPCCSLTGREVLYLRFCSTVCDLVNGELVTITPSSSNAHCNFLWNGNLFVPGNIDIEVTCNNGGWGISVACNAITPGGASGVVVSCSPLCIRFDNLYMSSSDHISAGVGCCKENIGDPPFQNGPMTVYLSDSPTAACLAACGGTTTGTGTGTAGGGECDGIIFSGANCCPGTCWPLLMHLTVTGCPNLNGTYTVNGDTVSQTWESSRFNYPIGITTAIRVYWKVECVPGSGIKTSLINDVTGEVYFTSTSPTPNCTAPSASSGVGSFTGPGSCHSHILTWTLS